MKTYFTPQRRKYEPIFLLVLIFLLTAGQSMKAGEPITVTHDLSSGSLTITKAHIGKDFLVTGTAKSYPGITIQPGYTGTVTLKNVTIIVPYKTSKSAMDIQSSSSEETHVTLKLIGKNLMENKNNSSSDPALLRVSTHAHVTIESYAGKDGKDSLTVKQPLSCWSAAIGTTYVSPYEQSGWITINSGTIYAKAGDNGAGIGGGALCAGGHITINGGDVTAISDARSGSVDSGAGIGSGYRCKDPNTFIRINGGKVTAVSLVNNYYYFSGSAIGGGNYFNGSVGGTTPPNYNDGSGQGDFGYIIITGGTIRASVRGYFDDGDPEPQQTYYGNNNHPKNDHLLDGRDGVGIGGGATPYAKGTIIVLPSADVTEVYGAKYIGTSPSTANGSTNPASYASGWDIGNCEHLFYLNKTPLRVGVGGTNNPKQTKIFTARTEPKQAGVEILADIEIANKYLPAVASQAGITGSGTNYIVGADTGEKDTLYYYTNSDVNFFTQAIAKDDGKPFEIWWCSPKYANLDNPEIDVKESEIESFQMIK